MLNWMFLSIVPHEWQAGFESIAEMRRMLTGIAEPLSPGQRSA